MSVLYLVPANFVESELDEDVAIDATELTVVTGGGAAFPAEYPYHVVIGGTEIVRVTNRVGDVLTIVRAQEDTIATAHIAGESVCLNVTAQYVSEKANRIAQCETILCFLRGGSDGVIRCASTDNLAVVAKAPPTMLVEVGSGGGFADATSCLLRGATDSAEVEAPTVDPRKDLVQVTNANEVEIKTGAEADPPVPPDPDPDAIALAHIFCRVGMTEIKNADDGANGYLIDARSYV